jgi:general secretion pathway protein G
MEGLMMESAMEPTSKVSKLHRSARKGLGRGFTLLEVMIVVVVLGILAAIVVPNFTHANDIARMSAAQNSLATFRAGIASFRANAVIAGTAAYPTLAELTTVGTVVAGDVPANPFTEHTTVQSVTQAEALARSVTGTAGWNYYVDNASLPPVAIIYINSTDTVTNNAGVDVPANTL